MTTILITEDQSDVRALLERVLRAEGFQVLAVENGARALEVLAQQSVDLVVLDLSMPQMGGLELLRRVRARPESYLPVILITGMQYSRDDMHEAMRLGADDFLAKPIDHTELCLRVRARLRMKDVYEEIARLARERDDASRDCEILRKQVARSSVASGPIRTPDLGHLFEMVETVAESSLCVLLTGETGTGKGLFARHIHDLGPRRKRPFVSVHCASIPASLLAGELFGHEKGAFTGADRDRVGRFEAADGGTLFLDEIGELPPELQVSLLRFLQDAEFERLGSSRTRHVDVRVIAATNCDLPRAILDGRFRSDLYYRLNVVGIEVPPLRRRPGDIPGLAQSFLLRSSLRAEKSVTAIDEAALERLLRHDWPGNARELQNVIDRAVVFAREGRIRTEDIRLDSPVPEESHGRGMGSLREGVWGAERQMILDSLKTAGGNQSAAARELGIPRTTLVTKMRRYGLSKP